MSTLRHRSLLRVGLLALCFGPVAASHAQTVLEVRVDFEGGSARNISIDQSARTIRFMPGGDPNRGWACWWYLRVEGTQADQPIQLLLDASDLPTRNNGALTDKPLDAGWSMPARAAVSTDGEHWTQTEPGRRDGPTMTYQVTPRGPTTWVAWGPPFTPRDTAKLTAEIVARTPAAQPLELARTRGGRAVAGIRFSLPENSKARPGIWVQARQHAWESGSSWVARGFAEWLAGDEADAKWLIEHAEVILIPIMDVDNVATGQGGKEADPRDHNRDWDDRPIYPEVVAAQRQLLEWSRAERLAVFLDLHNPAPKDLRPFFFCGPPDLLSDEGRRRRSMFMEAAARQIAGPLPVLPEPRLTGPAYHPLWRQISGQWVNAHGNSHTMAACLETSWNTPHSTTDGYREVGRQLGRAVAEYLRKCDH